MTTIAGYMSEDHRECDEMFSEVESAASRGEWVVVGELWPRFEASMRTHFEAEEEILFPEIESATGMTQGPTEVMRMDHRQIRALLQSCGEAISGEDLPRLLGLCETLMITIQQHNMKEEQVLYPMADSVIPAADTVIEKMRARIRRDVAP
jgi:iron-sulfur cluster repair protein YtfE (RIC family)